jgi:formylglycine-generating enzyme required for sulfatase activity
VGLKKPNDFGLFDSQGNCFTWCQEAYAEYPRAEGDEAVEDREGNVEIVSTLSRVLRGGSFTTQSLNVRASYRNSNVPANRSVDSGFRPARTLRP